MSSSCPHAGLPVLLSAGPGQLGWSDRASQGQRRDTDLGVGTSRGSGAHTKKGSSEGRTDGVDSSWRLLAGSSTWFSAPRSGAGTGGQRPSIPHPSGHFHESLGEEGHYPRDTG